MRHWPFLTRLAFSNEKAYAGEMVSITDEYMGVSQLLGARARAAPKVG